MSYRIEKTSVGKDIVIDGWEQGIAPSPHKGIANIQNANISTELGEVNASFARTAQQQVAITGGTLTAISGGGSGTGVAPAGTISYLVVGGGGGGGKGQQGGSQGGAGGGGAGQMATGTTSVDFTTYSITVGAGGTGSTSTSVAGTSGSSSSIGSLVTAVGGGGGASFSASAVSGGSGGGGAGPSGTGAVGTAGNNGGNGNSSGSIDGAGGGGGGAGAAGSNASISTGGNGGAGSASSISGSSVTYAGGGGGGSTSGSSAGGAGGGGAGGSPAVAGTANTGGGGGGDDGYGNNGAAGGSGIVIISYPTGSLTATGGTITTAGGNTIHTFTSDGNFTITGSVFLSAPSNLKAGDWITLTSSNIAGLPDNTSPITSVSIDYLIVGGGGGGGSAQGNPAGGGGGGAGEVVEDTGNVSVGTYAISVGEGGSGGVLSQGNDGESSSIATIASADGGGGGGYGQTSSQNGRSGGSGGGGGATSGTTAGTGGTGNGPPTGNNGGNGYQDGTDGAGGGGGGWGGVGQVGTNSGTGHGGNGGLPGTSSISGTSKSYGSGGGGGGGTTGGLGGGSANDPGGAGDGGSGAQDGFDAQPNTGSGGGGAGSTAISVQAGGDGGSGIVIISYDTGAMLATGGNITFAGRKTIHTFNEDGVFEVISIVSAGFYYVSYKDASNQIKLSAHYDPYAEHPITHGTTGTATFDTLAVIDRPLAKATEKYGTGTDIQYRYYILDALGHVWVYDTGVYAYSLATWGVGTEWMLPDPTDYSTFGFTGMAVLNGWLMVISPAFLYGKPTADLGRFFYSLPNASLNDPFPTHKNFAYVGHQGKMYYCDSNYIGEVFPTTSLVTKIANIQSYSQYTASGTEGTITSILSGSLPYSPDGTNIPVVFFTDQYGTMPTAISEGTVYYADYNPSNMTFMVYTDISGSGSPLDLSTGATGNQYFNTFFPLGADAGIGGTHSLVQFTPQRLNLPTFEVSQCLTEIGNIILVGCSGNVVYPWNQVNALPDGIISLPESNVQTMETVNQMAYLFAGNNGNIYITDGSTASLVLNMPDYVGGVPGSPGTYIEPQYYWGGSMYLRGRVYFGIQDQTATKVGNCGGIWSFYPTQNLYVGQDTGLALRLEAQNSYGDYDGVARLLIQNQVQDATAPLYWSAWESDVVSPTYGIDYSTEGTLSSSVAVIETDALPVGTLLNKGTFTNLEFKLGAPLDSGASVSAQYRTTLTEAWKTCPAFKMEANRLSGYIPANFEKSQWLMFRFTLTPISSSADTNTFIRFREIRLRGTE